jgi:diacylglycerol kinase (ATP)
MPAESIAMQPLTPRRRFILNPTAGTKAGVQTSFQDPEQIRSLLADRQLGDDLVVTETEEEAVAAVQSAVEQQFDAVVAIGGDGTAGLVARELLGTQTALGLIPSGSVMNIGRMLGIPRDPEAAVAIVASGRTVTIDVGAVNGSVFFEAGSVGLNAPVFQAAQRFDSGERRSILEAIWVAVRYRPARMTITMDEGIVVTRALVVTVANGAYTGMGFTVAPDALLDDGKFDVTIFRRFSRTGLLIHFCRIAFGRRSYSPRVTTYRSSTVKITSVHPLPCRADSHDLGTTPVTFSCRPAMLKVIVPNPDGIG